MEHVKPICALRGCDYDDVSEDGYFDVIACFWIN